MKCGIYSVGNMFVRIYVYFDRKKVKFCLFILFVCNTNVVVSFEFVYFEVWEEESVQIKEWFEFFFIVS